MSEFVAYDINGNDLRRGSKCPSCTSRCRQPVVSVVSDGEVLSNPENVVDNYPSTLISSNQEIDLVFTFEKPIILSQYGIGASSAASALEDAPTQWILYGSNTNTPDSWVKLDEVADEIDWGLNEIRFFSLSENY